MDAQQRKNYLRRSQKMNSLISSFLSHHRRSLWGRFLLFSAFWEVLCVCQLIRILIVCAWLNLRSLVWLGPVFWTFLSGVSLPALGFWVIKKRIRFTIGGSANLMLIWRSWEISEGIWSLLFQELAWSSSPSPHSSASISWSSKKRSHPSPYSSFPMSPFLSSHPTSLPSQDFPQNSSRSKTD